MKYKIPQKAQKFFTAMAIRGERGIARVLDKIEDSVNNGQYYEAHQMYRTLYFRYLNQKKYVETLQLLYKGSTLLLQRGQQTSGADLGILLLEVLTKSETKPDEEWISKISQIFGLMSKTIPERETYLTNAIKWSMNNTKKGHPLLHKKIAEVYWKEKKYSAAHKHFLHSNDGETFATMLIELHTSKGYKAEVDLFIAQAVFQLLCLRNMKTALDAFNKYTATHPAINNATGPPYPTPLLNFLWFLFRAIEEKNVVKFNILKKWYAISLKRDPNYFGYLKKVGRIWFGLEVRRERNHNSMIGGLLRSIIGEVESPDEDGDFNKQSGSAPDLD